MTNISQADAIARAINEANGQLAKLRVESGLSRELQTRIAALTEAAATLRRVQQMEAEIARLREAAEKLIRDIDLALHAAQLETTAGTDLADFILQAHAQVHELAALLSSAPEIQASAALAQTGELPASLNRERIYNNEGDEIGGDSGGKQADPANVCANRTT